MKTNYGKDHDTSKEEILKSMEFARVFECSLSDDCRWVCINESCDGHFSAELDKKEFGNLILALQDIHSKMKD